MQRAVREWLRQLIKRQAGTGVGAGNTPASIDKSADILKAVNSIIHSKTFDNGMICASEQSTIVDKTIYKEVRKEFEYRGCYFLKRMSLISS